MGADLIVISIPGFSPTPERRERIKSLILSPSEIPAAVYDVLGYDPGEDTAEIREAWSREVLGAFDALDNGRQISSVYTHKGDNSWVYVTGGSSWGDEPSDYYNGFVLMHHGGILEEMRRWAFEDLGGEDVLGEFENLDDSTI